MGKYLVTRGQWLVGSTLPSSPARKGYYLNSAPSYSGRINDSVGVGDKLPVEQVSWLDAVEFCDRLSAKTGKKYRLPSEAEWEYACRAGTTTAFNLGDTITTDSANYDATRGNYEGNRLARTSVVNAYPPNGFGLYDMHGNVWEWCQDTWHENYEGAPNDGSAWLDESAEHLRVVRGGSWCSNLDICRSAYRFRQRTDTKLCNIGFRLVCEIEQN